MNEVKLSTTVTQQSARLAIKLNLKDLGVDWASSDIIRVISNKDDKTLVLKRVGVKSKKTVAHKLTSTGSGEFKNDFGIYMSYTPQRFPKKFTQVKSVNAGARFKDKKKTMLEVFLPREIFEQEVTA